MQADIVDIVVVGGGGAGLMAALAAASRGSSVVLLEKAEQLGGTTALSVGTVCVSGTPQQKRQGITDNPQDHFEDLGLFAGELGKRDNLELRRLLVEEVPETFKQLMQAGVQFVGPFEEPPHRVPRLHAIVPHSRGFIHCLATACRRKGVDLRTGARVDSLIYSEDRSSVVGVAMSGEHGSRRIRASKAVILASGDFSSSDTSYKSRFMKGPLLEIGGVNPTSTGDGQRLGEDAGGEVVNGDLAWGPEIRFMAPPRPRLVAKLPPLPIIGKVIAWAMRALPDKLLRPFLLSYVTTYLAPSHALFREGAILVDRNGDRFCDERKRPQDFFGPIPEQQAFVVFDASIAERFAEWPNFVSTAPGVGYAYLADYARSRTDIFHRAPDVAGLAASMAVDAAALRMSIDQMRRANGGPVRAPFYALGPAKSWIVFSEGGLRVDRDMRVLRKDGGPVPGLYAAGSAGQGGVILEGHGHHLAWAFTSGRIAGERAAMREVVASASIGRRHSGSEVADLADASRRRTHLAVNN